jgi:hypothetical protein
VHVSAKDQATGKEQQSMIFFWKILINY